MGIFNIFAFWRKKEQNETGQQNDNEGSFEYGEQQTEIPPWNNEYDNTGMRRRNQENFSRPAEWQQPMHQMQQQPQQNYGNSNEIILAKLDVINVKLDSLNQRLANLERYASEEKKSRW